MCRWGWGDCVFHFKFRKCVKKDSNFGFGTKLFITWTATHLHGTITGRTGHSTERCWTVSLSPIRRPFQKQNYVKSLETTLKAHIENLSIQYMNKKCSNTFWVFHFMYSQKEIIWHNIIFSPLCYLWFLVSSHLHTIPCLFSPGVGVEVWIEGDFGISTKWYCHRYMCCVPASSSNGSSHVGPSQKPKPTHSQFHT